MPVFNVSNSEIVAHKESAHETSNLCFMAKVTSTCWALCRHITRDCSVAFVSRFEAWNMRYKPAASRVALSCSALQCLVFADDAHWHSASHACAEQIQQRVSSTSCPVQERLCFFWYDCGHVHHACLHTLYGNAVLHSMRQTAIRICCQRKCDSRQVL